MNVDIFTGTYGQEETPNLTISKYHKPVGPRYGHGTRGDAFCRHHGVYNVIKSSFPKYLCIPYYDIQIIARYPTIAKVNPETPRVVEKCPSPFLSGGSPLVSAGPTVTWLPTELQ